MKVMRGVRVVRRRKNCGEGVCWRPPLAKCSALPFIDISLHHTCIRHVWNSGKENLDHPKFTTP